MGCQFNAGGIDPVEILRWNHCPGWISG